MREFFDLGGNPLFVKFVRSRLRRGALIPMMLMTLFICLGMVILHIDEINDQFRPDPLSFPKKFFILQWIILCVMGGSQVASAVSHINESRIIDFHRVTPMPAKVQTIGIMLGAPIRELILYAITLPFSFFTATAQNGLGIENWSKLLLVQLGAAILYYTLAMVSGLSARSSRGASGRFVTLLVILNVSASALYELTIYGPTLITVYPMYEEAFKENEPPPPPMNQGGPIGNANAGNANAGNVMPVERKPTFYSADIPVVLQSLMFQGVFIYFFFIAATRRIRSERLLLYSKPIAMLFFTCITILTLGSVWDAPQAFQVLGMVYFLSLCGLMLISGITPPLGEVAKGMQRAWKMTNSLVPPWSDLATNKYTIIVFGAIMTGAIALGILASPKPPLPWFFLALGNFDPWPPILVGICSLGLVGFSLQYFHLTAPSRTTLYVAMLVIGVWIFPLLMGGMITNGNREVGKTMMAISPIVGVAYSGGIFIGLLDPLTAKLAAVVPSALLSAIFFALLLKAERRLRADVQMDNDERKPLARSRKDRYPEEE